LPRVDAWFEVHLPVFDKTRPYPYLGWLSEGAPKVYIRDKLAMQMKFDHGPLFPNAVEFPEQEVRREFGPFNFTSSISIMLMKAILDIEAKLAKPQIGLWGIMQASKNEYTSQRPGIQNMIWEAVRRGIKVFAPPESRLFHPVPEDF
jgi:hypothetical protein